METITSVEAMRSRSRELRAAGKTIALVPTMGFLHDGHSELIRRARKACDAVITSVFVNPMQFAPNEDFRKYPRDIERDSARAAEAGCDILFVPDAGAMYPNGYATYIEIEGIARVLEGKFRPTHFRGVATVVAKLFMITHPTIAFFGQKDAQQCVVVKRLVADLNLDVRIEVVPTVREKDGLAMSSRNIYLSPAERSDALVLSRSLRKVEELVRAGERNTERIRKAMLAILTAPASVTVDYAAVVGAETLEPLGELKSGDTALIAIAARVGSTRLIDNTLITIRD